MGNRYEVQVIDRKRADQFAYVNDAATSEVARAFTGPDAIADAEEWARVQNAYVAACREDAERMATSGDDDLIHWWTSDTGSVASCGVDVMHTPYTFGSPVLADVTCKACLLVVA